MRTKSVVPHVHEFRNLICDGCNVVVTYPEITEERLVEYYNGEYRDDPTSTIQIGNEHLAPPIHIHRSGISFQRFQTFHRVVASIASSLRNAPPGPGDLVIDIGGYQGMFLSAAQRVWNCDCILYDYNRAGVKFAKSSFSFHDAIVAQDVYTDSFGRKAKYVTLIHVFEHLRYPRRFLRVRRSLLVPGGFIYVEIPSVFGRSLNDPTHFYMYNAENIRYLFEDEGFEVLAIEETDFPDSRHSWLPRINIACLARVRPLASKVEPVSRPVADSVPCIVKSIGSSADEHRFILDLLRTQFKTTVKMFWNLTKFVYTDLLTGRQLKSPLKRGWK